MALAQLKGIGPHLLSKFAKLNILTVSDLLFHLPRDYQDRTKLSKINKLYLGQYAQIEGIITQSQVVKTRKKMLKLIISDDQGAQIDVTFFHFYPNQISLFRKGQAIRLFGQVSHQSGRFSLIHPEYQILSHHKNYPLSENLTPIYPATEGLSSQMIAKYIRFVLNHPKDYLDDLMPIEIRQQHGLGDLYEALNFIHMPPKNVNLNQLRAFQYPQQKRLVIEELTAHRLSIHLVKTQKEQFYAYAMVNQLKLDAFLQQMPFIPTNAQLRVINELKKDLLQKRPMSRLIQGDVGSGKTLVAAAATMLVAENHYQTAVMAPTEILAQQHYETFKKWFAPFSIEVGLIANKTTQKQRKQLLEQLKSGEIDILIGTHAIFQEGIEFQKLALIIIDEQHRFGVKQRYDLLNKGLKDYHSPHQLVMSATPIPRTLTMTIYGDLNVSVIDELPKGRAGIQTVVFSDHKRNDLVNKLTDEFKKGLQAYWVCPLIEESEVLSELQAAENLLELLKNAFQGIEVALIHGKMKPKEKLSIMTDFKEGKIKLLVATTVIEVGVDVPNASVMVIENPERLGLSQLHQLRGRVGRGKLKGTCILLYHPPLTETAKSRLNVMRESTDGFMIAEKDLALRGPGELLGTKQTGNITFKIADLMRDQNELDRIKTIADTITKQQPDIIPKLINRWLGDGLKFKKA